MSCQTVPRPPFSRDVIAFSCLIVGIVAIAYLFGFASSPLLFALAFPIASGLPIGAWMEITKSKKQKPVLAIIVVICIIGVFSPGWGIGLISFVVFLVSTLVGASMQHTIKADAPAAPPVDGDSDFD